MLYKRFVALTSYQHEILIQTDEQSYVVYNFTF